MTELRFTRRQLVAAMGAASLSPVACARDEGSPEPVGSDTPPWEPGAPLPWRNWAGSQACIPADRLAPGDEEELAHRLATTTGALRPVGAGHSFTPLVPTEGTLVSLDRLSGVIETDEVRVEAEVFAGTRLFDLGPALFAAGQSMHNLPDIDQQALAGAVATSTHGTGVTLGSLSSSVVALSLMTAEGATHRCSAEQQPELFHAARTSLGALGLTTRMRLGNRPAERLSMTQDMRPTEEVLDDIEGRKQHQHFEMFVIPGSSYSIEVIADPTDSSEIAIPYEDPGGVEALAALRDALARLPVVGPMAFDALLRLLIEPAPRVGPAYAVLANLRLVPFNEMEYTVPAEAGPSCLREILDQMARMPGFSIWPIEYRYVRADDVWLSPFFERDGCSISLHQPVFQEDRRFFDILEPIFWKYDGRPHWGKLHSLDAARFSHLYPRWRDFLEVRSEFDPAGRFLNPHLRRVFGIA